MAKSAIPTNPAIMARAAAVQGQGVPAAGMPAKKGKKKRAAAPAPMPAAAPAPPAGPMPAKFRGKTTGRDTSDSGMPGA